MTLFNFLIFQECDWPPFVLRWPLVILHAEHVGPTFEVGGRVLEIILDDPRMGTEKCGCHFRDQFLFAVDFSGFSGSIHATAFDQRATVETGRVARRMGLMPISA